MVVGGDGGGGLRAGVGRRRMEGREEKGWLIVVSQRWNYMLLLYVRALAVPSRCTVWSTQVANTEKREKYSRQIFE